MFDRLQGSPWGWNSLLFFLFFLLGGGDGSGRKLSSGGHDQVMECTNLTKRHGNSP